MPVDNIFLENDSRLLSKSKPKTKIGSSYSTWENIISGLPQDSVLGLFM